MLIRQITADDTEAFFRMMCLLDEETDHMMYEPGERRQKKVPEDLKPVIGSAVSGKDLLLIAENDDRELVGFIHAARGKPNRISHTAYIVIGIRRAYRQQGIGTAFFQRLDAWAKANGVIRLELTVECTNTIAIRLYESQGFRVEGVRSRSMKVNGRLADEYYMARILE